MSAGVGALFEYTAIQGRFERKDAVWSVSSQPTIGRLGTYHGLVPMKFVFPSKKSELNRQGCDESP
jgi:hypothetical protein